MPAARPPLPAGEGLGERGPRASEEGQAERRPNAAEDGIDVVADFLVRETQHVDADAFENFCPTGVVIRKPFVLLAVELNDELGGVAVEVGDVAVERNLPAIPGSEPGDRAVKA